MTEDIHNIENTNQIINMYISEGKSFLEIANIFKCSHHTIKKLLVKNGVTLRKPTNTKEKVEDAELLVELYQNNTPILEMCSILGVGRRAIERYVNEYGLKRSSSMMSRDQYDSTKDETIINLYNNGMTMEKIAEIVGISRGAVKNHLQHNSVDLRDISESLFLHNQKEFPSILYDYNEMYDMYVSRRLSKKNIAETLNVAPHVVDRCLKKLGIPIRGVSESKYGLMVGENHPNWKGGRTSLYAKLRVYFKTRQTRKALKRDGHTCQLCGSKEDLEVHHIKQFHDIFNEILNEHKNLTLAENEDELYYIMINDSRFNDIDNLITYCRDCHLFRVHGYKKHT